MSLKYFRSFAAFSPKSYFFPFIFKRSSIQLISLQKLCADPEKFKNHLSLTVKNCGITPKCIRQTYNVEINMPRKPDHSWGHLNLDNPIYNKHLPWKINQELPLIDPRQANLDYMLKEKKEEKPKKEKKIKKKKKKHKCLKVEVPRRPPNICERKVKKLWTPCIEKNPRRKSQRPRCCKRLKRKKSYPCYKKSPCDKHKL